MALNEDVVNEAVSTIKTLHSEFITFREDQKAVNSEQKAINGDIAKEITEVKLKNVEKEGVLKAIEENQKRILGILEKRPSQIREWLGTLSPYIIIGGGVLLFYIQNKGGVP